ncbi:hypothetical protein KGQ19_00630 [Catenulispora sp. NL8]|uniref:Lipoprotein n=1 Tax=Catenulispora pinistramenti TaxID=2705254 RepID=A0ABS5KGK8_9ACTN|nr:hypothetical protein [Catenulispora pinistramenti]MBS2545364.1 hypothetical protein [Catenulispora pinistramenti]
MITIHRRNLTCVAAVIVVASWTTGCGGGSQTGGSQPSATIKIPSPDSTVVVTQLVLDTGVLPVNDVDPGVVVDGVVKDGSQFTTWYATTTSDMLLSQNSKVKLWDEAGKVTTAINSMGKGRTSDSLHSTALGILAQELVDANLINAQTLGGAVDSAGKVNLGNGLNTWYSAHQNDVLPGGTGVTYATEVTRIVTVLQGAPS